VSMPRFLLALTAAAAAFAQETVLAPGAPALPLKLTDIKLQGVKVDMISSIAAAPDGTLYLLQRGPLADPVIVIDRQGRVLRSWGKGLYEIPHSIRLDPQGNVWTVDSASSMVYKFTRDGKKLMEISVGGQPANHRSPFKGTSDIAFGVKGQLYISDGYANARVLEYTPDGKPVRAWGTPGQGPGEFNLPHGIAIDNSTGTLFVADRENGRIQRFDLTGRYLGEIQGLGKTFSLDFVQGALWIGTQPRHLPNGAPGWIMKVEPKTGQVLGKVDSPGHHSVTVTRDGEVFTGVRPDRLLWFRRK